MATKLFYGRSLSAADVEKKQVTVERVEYLVVDGKPIEIEPDYNLFLTQEDGAIDYDVEDDIVVYDGANDNPLDFASGDLLVCYFSYGNLVAQPWLQITIKDAEDSASTTEDYGHAVKTQSPDSDMSGLWRNGEVLIFTYVRLNRKVGYWFIANRAIATPDYYGTVKLTDSIMPDDNPKAVMTKETTLKLLNQGSPGYLQYQPSIIPSEQSIKLGRMVLYGYGEEPLSDFDIYIPSVPELSGQTSDFYNDGPRKREGEAETEANVGYGHPYITKIVPGNLMFRTGFGQNEPIGLSVVMSDNSEQLVLRLRDTFDNTHMYGKKNLLLHGRNGYIGLDGGVELVLDAEDEGDRRLYDAIVAHGWTDCIQQEE